MTTIEYMIRQYRYSTYQTNVRVWQFTEEEMSDSQPEMYWSDEEKIVWR